MKSLLIKLGVLVMVSFFVMSCKKGDTYCKLPIKITGVYGMKASYLPSESVNISLLFENEKETNIENTLYSFSTPEVFVNPKGNYTEDIVRAMNYSYLLKDTINYPSSVDVSVYSFNDCGESEPLTIKINYQ